MFVQTLIGLCRKWVLGSQNRTWRQFLKNEFVIFDEAHVLRNLTSIMQLQIDALRQARFLQTLTATLTINHISDIIALCQMHGGDLTENEIKELKTNKDISHILVDDILTRCFENRIDWYDAKDDLHAGKFYAPITIIVKNIPMTWEQTVDYMVKKRNNFVIGDSLCITTSARNSYRKNQKQISNSSNNDIFSPKFNACCDLIESFNKFPIIVYSNYLANGIKAIYGRLKRKREDLKIDIATGTTKTSDRELKRLAINSKKLDILCLSSIGNASLDFAGIKALFLLDSFDDFSSEKQAIGRVSRFKAHQLQKDGTLDPVMVFKFISTFPNAVDIKEEDEQRITDYFYKTYCNPKVGSTKELIPFNFTKELIKKIQKEENNKTVEQQLEISNIYTNNTLEPANKKFKSLGS